MGEVKVELQPEEVRADIPDDVRRRISAGMRRSHATRKALALKGQKEAPAGGGLLGRLRRERDELNVTIRNLEQRGIK